MRMKMLVEVTHDSGVIQSFLIDDPSIGNGDDAAPTREFAAMVEECMNALRFPRICQLLSHLIWELENSHGITSAAEPWEGYHDACEKLIEAADDILEGWNEFDSRGEQLPPLGEPTEDE